MNVHTQPPSLSIYCSDTDVHVAILLNNLLTASLVPAMLNMYVYVQRLLLDTSKHMYIPPWEIIFT